MSEESRAEANRQAEERNALLVRAETEVLVGKEREVLKKKLFRDMRSSAKLAGMFSKPFYALKLYLGLNNS